MLHVCNNMRLNYDWTKAFVSARGLPENISNLRKVSAKFSLMKSDNIAIT